MDKETSEILIKILKIQHQIAALTHDALVRVCALKRALEDPGSELDTRYRTELDHCDQSADAELIRKSYADIDALVLLLEHEGRYKEAIN